MKNLKIVVPEKGVEKEATVGLILMDGKTDEVIETFVLFSNERENVIDCLKSAVNNVDKGTRFTIKDLANMLYIGLYNIKGKIHVHGEIRNDKRVNHFNKVPNKNGMVGKEMIVHSHYFGANGDTTASIFIDGEQLC